MDSASMVVAKKQAITTAASGYKNYSVSYDTDGSPILTINFQNGDSANLKFPLAPKGDKGEDGVSVNGASVKDGHLVLTKDDGSELDCGVLPTSDYDDTEIRTLIQTVSSGLMASAGYSSDYKTIDIVTVGGNKKSIDVKPVIEHAKVVELEDVDETNIGNGKVIVYNAATGKHEYTEVSGTDEKVKMDSSSDAKYLSELLDGITVSTNASGKLTVKKLDGQEVTIEEINYLKGMKMNVMDLVNMFANGGVKIITTPVNTYADLLSYDKSQLIEGISYLIYVLADENHDGAKTTYLIDTVSATPTYFGYADSQRDFITNPINLVSEITGKLGISNIDLDALWNSLTVDDTYKTTTSTDNVFGTHGAKALYDELMQYIGSKANTSDLTSHIDDTDIHVSTSDKETWNKVVGKAEQTDLDAHTTDTTIHVTSDDKTSWNDKIDKTSITDTISSVSTDDQVPSAKTVYDKYSLHDLSEAKDNFITDSLLVHTSIQYSKYNKDGIVTMDSTNIPSDLSWGIRQVFWHDDSDLVVKITGKDLNNTPCIWINSLSKNDTGYKWHGWKKVCTTKVSNVNRTNITNKISGVTDGNIFYSVKNGFCHLEFLGVKVENGNITNIDITNILPLSNGMGFTPFYNVNDKICGRGMITNNILAIEVYTTSVNGGWGTITYPVVES